MATPAICVKCEHYRQTGTLTDIVERLCALHPNQHCEGEFDYVTGVRNSGYYVNFYGRRVQEPWQRCSDFNRFGICSDFKPKLPWWCVLLAWIANTEPRQFFEKGV